MSLNTYPRMSIVGKAASVAAVVALSLPLVADAAGLGKITVLSALGQPLKAEIELTNVSNRERGSLVANIGKPEDFANAKIEFDPSFSSLNFAIKQQGERDVIEVTSSQPINLALVNVLIEVTGGRRRLLREYSFLLDPPRAQRDVAAQAAVAAKAAGSPATPAAAPAVKTPAPATAASAAPQPTPTPAAPATKPAPAVDAAKPAVKAAETPANKPADKPVTQPAAQPAVKPAAATPAPAPAAPDRSVATSGDHRVAKGDMLSRIALRHKPKGVSLNQMMIALYRANPDAFVNNNINRLKSGAILALPTADAVRGIDNQEARAVVVAHTEDFDEYRNQLAGKVGAGTAKKPARAAQSAEGKVAVKVEENKPTAEPQDKLTLSSAGKDTNVHSGTSTSSGASAEDKVAADKARADASARAQELEKNIAGLQKLLEMNSPTLAAGTDAAATPPAGNADVAADDKTPAVADGDSDRVAEIKDKAGELGEKTQSFWAKTTEAIKHAADSVGHNQWTWPIVGGVLFLAALLTGGIFAWRRKQNGEEEAGAEGADATVDTENEAVAPTGLPETVIGTPEQSSGVGGQTFDVSELAEDDTTLVDAPPAPNLADKIDFDLDLDSAAPAEPQEPFIGGDTAAATNPATDPVTADTAAEVDTAAAQAAPAEPEAETASATAPIAAVAAVAAATAGAAAATAAAANTNVTPEATPATSATPAPVTPETVTPAQAQAPVDAIAAADPLAAPAPLASAEEKLELDLPPEVPANAAQPEEETAFSVEMNMKLDLAAAYQEIGDNEGARELLEEVINGGNEELAVRAREMLGALV